MLALHVARLGDSHTARAGFRRVHNNVSAGASVPVSLSLSAEARAVVRADGMLVLRPGTFHAYGPLEGTTVSMGVLPCALTHRAFRGQ